MFVYLGLGLLLYTREVPPPRNKRIQFEIFNDKVLQSVICALNIVFRGCTPVLEQKSVFRGWKSPAS